jgi:hypothetical protein
LAEDESGRLVVFDPVRGTISRSGDQPLQVTLSDDLAAGHPWLVAVGPHDVAYIATQTPGVRDPIGDVIAVTLRAEDAGRTIARFSQVVDRTGDSTLHATRAGLRVAPCCGTPVKPPLDGPVIVEWVDSNGNPTTSSRPELWTEVLPNGGLKVVREDQETRSWFLPDTTLSSRDPSVPIATNDGGAILWINKDNARPPEASVFVLAPDGAVRRATIRGYFPALIEAQGTVITYHDGAFYRIVPIASDAQP